MKEIWKDIKGYEGFYQVSNMGRVKSIDRKDSNGHQLKGKLLSQSKGTNGYYGIKLSKNNVHKSKEIHRLVAETFLSNKNECVNHKDGNKENNKLDNLEWCTKSYNAIHAFKNGLSIPTWLGKKGKMFWRAKRVVQYDKNNSLIKIWNCIIDVEREIGLDSSSICSVCKGKHKSCGGYIWRYVDE